MRSEEFGLRRMAAIRLALPPPSKPSAGHDGSSTLMLQSLPELPKKPQLPLCDEHVPRFSEFFVTTSTTLDAMRQSSKATVDSYHCWQFPEGLPDHCGAAPNRYLHEVRARHFKAFLRGVRCNPGSLVNQVDLRRKEDDLSHM